MPARASHLHVAQWWFSVPPALPQQADSRLKDTVDPLLTAGAALGNGSTHEKLSTGDCPADDTTAAPAPGIPRAGQSPGQAVAAPAALRATAVPRRTSCGCRLVAQSNVCGRIISIGYWSATPAYKVTTLSKHGIFFKLSVTFFFFIFSNSRYPRRAG